MKQQVVEKYNGDKSKILGQFFTKESIVEKLIDILLEYKNYDRSIKILEPSFGTGNFIKVLEKRGFNNVDGCEIDAELTGTPRDFFEHSIKEKYDLIIGNPPFSKFNIRESYFATKNYIKSACSPIDYMPRELLDKEKEKIENAFILKSLKHLNSKDSSIAFVLPVSFFIKNRNRVVKNVLSKNFGTIIIYQNTEIWFDYNISCCFAIFTNTITYNDKIVSIYKNNTTHREIINIDKINEEIIPEVFYNKKENLINNYKDGIPLENYLSSQRMIYKHAYNGNNVSAKNILEKTVIPLGDNVSDYKLAVVRVGNSSIGKCGLINTEKDTLNDMFYVFGFAEKFTQNKQIKEQVCAQINKNQNYFKNITCRVGSKSIKKEDIFNFRIVG